METTTQKKHHTKTAKEITYIIQNYKAIGKKRVAEDLNLNEQQVYNTFKQVRDKVKKQIENEVDEEKKSKLQKIFDDLLTVPRSSSRGKRNNALDDIIDGLI